MTEALDMPPLLLKGQSGGTIAYHSRVGKPEQSKAGIIFCGGYRSNMEGNKAVALDRFSQSRGCGFVRFDYEGHGKSSGDFEDGTIGRWYENTQDIFDEITVGPQIVIGSSMGGWMAMLLARARPERVKALVLIAPAPDFPTCLLWENLPEDERQKLINNGLLTKSSKFKDGDYPYTWKMIDESRQHNLLAGGSINYQGPVHIFIGDDDEVVSVAHAKRAADVFASDQVDFKVIPGGDHRLSDPNDIIRLYNLLDKFLNN